MRSDSPHSKRRRSVVAKTLFWCVAIFLFVLPWQACGPTLVPLEGGLDGLRRGPGTGGSGNGDVYTGMRSLKTLARSVYRPGENVLPGASDEYHRFVRGQQCSANPTGPEHAGLIRYLTGEWRLQPNACSATESTISGITIHSYSPEVLSWQDKIYGLSERRDDLFTSAYPLAWCRSSSSPHEGLSVVIAEKIIDATPAGDGALSLSFPSDLTGLPRGVSFARNDSQPTATYVDSRGLIATAAVGAPRLDHDPVSGDALGLLIEEARINYAVQSAALDTWTRTGGTTIAPDAVVSPDGKTTAENVTLASSSAALTHSLPSVSSPSPFTFSIFVRASSGTITLDYENATVLASATYDLGAKKVASIDGSAEAVLQRYQGQWARLVLTFSHLGGPGAKVRMRSASSRTFPAWGAQIENGAYATSYIPTLTAPVERKADSLVANDLKMFENGIGALFVRFLPLDGQTRGTVFDAKDANGRTLSAQVESGQLKLISRQAGASSSVELGSIRGYSDVRVAVATANQTATAAVSGALRTYRAPLATASQAFTSLTIGRDSAGGSTLSGHLRRITQWNHELAYGTLVHESGYGKLPLQGQISLGDATATERRQVFNFQVDRSRPADLAFVSPDYDFDLRVTRAATTATSGTATIEVAIDDVLYRDELTCTLEPGNIN